MNRAERRQKQLMGIRHEAENMRQEGSLMDRLQRRQFSKNIKRLSRRAK